MTSSPQAPGAASPAPGSSKLDRPARVGLRLFLLYCLVYGGFIMLSAFAPQVMGRRVIQGVNLAIVYGFALIGGALFLAVVYMLLADERPGGSHAGRHPAAPPASGPSTSGTDAQI